MCSTILYVEGNLESKIFNDPLSGLVRRIREVAVRLNGMEIFLLFYYWCSKMLYVKLLVNSKVSTRQIYVSCSWWIYDRKSLTSQQCCDSHVLELDYVHMIKSSFLLPMTYWLLKKTMISRRHVPNLFVTINSLKVCAPKEKHTLLRCKLKSIHGEMFCAIIP